MVQDAAEPFFSNISLSDMLMTIYARSEGCFGIVRVNDLDVFNAENRFGLGHGQLQAFGGGDVIMAAGEAMGCIETKADLKTDLRLQQLPDHHEFFKAAAD